MPDDITPTLPTTLVEALHRARHVGVLTGAGVSADSGLATFRDAQTGLWARYRPEDLATPEAFARNPALVWRWYAWRREQAAAAMPNAAHRALTALAQHVPRLCLITQNVDGLHQRAGSSGVIELHGNIHRSRCSGACGLVDTAAADGAEPPACPRCGRPLRPDVVWFGEALPQAALHAASTCARTSDLFLVVGTSSLVQPAASLPLLAREAGALVVEVNLAATALSDHASFVLRGRAGHILPALVRAAWANAM